MRSSYNRRTHFLILILYSYYLRVFNIIEISPNYEDYKSPNLHSSPLHLIFLYFFSFAIIYKIGILYISQGVFLMKSNFRKQRFACLKTTE